MASAFVASSSVPSGKGSPEASYAAPPTGACSISNARPLPLSAASTLTASAMTSVPTPSPGRTAIFIKRRRLAEQPGLFGAATLFEGADLVRVAQSESYIVQTVEQGVFEDGATGGRKPCSAVAQGACSRELPQPKFSRASSMLAPL